MALVIKHLFLSVLKLSCYSRLDTLRVFEFSISRFLLGLLTYSLNEIFGLPGLHPVGLYEHFVFFLRVDPNISAILSNLAVP